MFATRKVTAEIFSIVGVMRKVYRERRLNVLKSGHTVDCDRERWPIAFFHCQPCIGTKDTACVDAYPVDCIHPKKNSTYNDGRPSSDDVSSVVHRSRGMHRLRGLRAGLTGLRHFYAGRPAREVEGIHGVKRKLRKSR